MMQIQSAAVNLFRTYLKNGFETTYKNIGLF